MIPRDEIELLERAEAARDFLRSRLPTLPWRWRIYARWQLLADAIDRAWIMLLLWLSWRITGDAYSRAMLDRLGGAR